MADTRLSRARASARGMTLVELLVVVAMIGVLAALALAGYSKYVDWATTASTKDIMGGLANGQAAYYADTTGYLSCASDWSDGEAYPMLPNGRKHMFHDPGHGDYACYRLLNPTVKEPTYMAFWVRAGSKYEGEDTYVAPPASLPVATALVDDGDLDFIDEKPWFMIIAADDRDEDKNYNYFMLLDRAAADVYYFGNDE